LIQGNDIRKLVVEVSAARGTGHVGCALSVCEAVAAIMNVKGPMDRFILSKGHAALAYYAAAHLQGWITRDKLFTYCQDGTHLGVHPEQGNEPTVLIGTGSLGMGLSIAAGMALELKEAKYPPRVFCLCSDAELDEGSTWEAVMFAGHHGLSNLALVIDHNNSQALGRKEDILTIDDIGGLLTEKLDSFGWWSTELDGHDQPLLEKVLDVPRSGPFALVATTTIGKGIPDMEGDYRSHYLPLTPAQILAFKEANP